MNEAVGVDSKILSPFSDSGEGVSLRFWGVRGSIAVPGATTSAYGGNTSCVEVRLGGEIFILDAGTGIRGLGHALATELGGEPTDLTLLISHVHWDHVQGLPFFAPAYQSGNRLRIYGYEGCRGGLAQILNNQMEHPYFPISMDSMLGLEGVYQLDEGGLQVGDVRVRLIGLNHPGGATGYRLEHRGCAVAYLTDNEPYTTGVSQPGVLQPTGTSGRDDQELVAFLREADVVVMDAQYDRQDYLEHLGWGHGCVDDVVRIACEAKVGRLYLFHHDPEHDDDRMDRIVAEAQKLAAGYGATTEVRAACEGEQWVLSGAVAEAH